MTYKVSFIHRMLLIIIAITVVGMAGLALLERNNYLPFPISQGSTGENSENSSDKPKLQKISVFSKEIKPLYFKPIHLYSNSINLNVSIMEVGVEEDGTLGIPSTWWEAGWYKDGAKPGEIGSLLIDGHYDTNTGAPAAFWELKNLKVNDTVQVVDEIGREFTYQILETFYVDIHDPNRIETLNSGDGAVLTLVTCGGVWLPEEGTYNKRLVMKGRLVSQ